MADRVGFEPTEPFGSPDFKSGAIDQLCHLSVYGGSCGIRTHGTY